VPHHEIGPSGVQTALDVLGIVAFAASGALLAVRRGFDVVGLTVLAFVAALGGGLIRDLMLSTTPVALTDMWYLGAVAVTALVTFLGAPLVHRYRNALLTLDAVGLGVFCATGTVKALDFGIEPLGAAVLGVISGCGGGMIRDLLVRDSPVIFGSSSDHFDSQLYAVPAFAGSLALALLGDHYPARVNALTIAVAVCIVLFRLGAMRWDWQAPRPRPL
jgi:uncharacterized membrane protein YeiH